MAVDYKHIEMIGRLAKDEEIKGFAAYGRTAVFINTRGEIQYNVKSLSVNNDINEEQFTGYIDSVQNLGSFVDDQYSTAEERVNKFSEYYSESLFVFSHKVDSMGNQKIDSAEVVPYPEKVDKNSKFVAIPCFSGKWDCDEIRANNHWQLFREYENFSGFYDCLIQNQSVGRIYNFQTNIAENCPEFIIWKDDQKMCAIGPVKAISRSAKEHLLIQINIEDYCEINLEDENDDIREYIVSTDTNPTLLHISEEKYIDIINRMTLKVAGRSVAMISKDTSAFQTVEQKVSGEGEVPTENSKYNQETCPESLKELPIGNTTDETAIFEFFHYHSQNSKLFYAPKDIVNFHTAIKTGSLVILSGMSGTGKSSLVDTYAKALGVGKNNVLMIPVRPAWNDDSDLLGYLDLIHMVYRPSDTGFINKIVEASQNKDKLFFVCFDEMNLARVEHYFSQFLSILEKPVGARKLVLYDKQYENKIYNSLDYPQEIPIGDNVKFIGTVNIDESTYHFSDKVLDRANVISLEILDYSRPENWKVDKYRAANTPEWTNEDFKQILKGADTMLNCQDRLREFLWEIHILLHNTNPNLGVGPRIVKSIEAYLRNLPKGDSKYVLSDQEGIDYQVAQRVLTKIRGPQEQLKELLLMQEGTNMLTVLFDNYSDISEFKRCRQIIEQKEKELKVYGYCL